MEEKTTNFFEDAKAIAKLIPYGRVCSYGEIAKYLGAVKSARMVGWALNSSKPEEKIPAHRVVNRKGLLTGKNHFEEPNQMQILLEKEGVKVINNQIQNLESIWWIPSNELI